VNRSSFSKRKVINRRSFLYGAGGIAIGLPFLEGLPERSAWAAESQPIFTLFICAACGVEPKRFWPSSTGPLSSVLSSGDQAVNQLKDHANNLLIIRGVNFPTQLKGCGHAEGLTQALTGAPPKSTGSQATASGPSVDFVISQAVNAPGTDPLTLYAGFITNGYIEDRLSIDNNGTTRAAADNPYKLYQSLVTIADPAGSGSSTGGSTPEPSTPSVTDELLLRRKSAVDQVHAELNALIQNPKLSAEDKQRLEQHFNALREVEITMTNPNNPVALFGCSLDGIDTQGLEAIQQYRYQRTNVAVGGMEHIVELHMQLVALAFACDYNRTATIQWGDGTDATIYEVASNQQLGNWGFHHISHRVQSDGALGQNSTAEAAHAEIDVLRMQTLARGLNHFRDRGLANNAAVLWTNHVAEGNHTMRNVPQIIWGNAGGYFKQGEYVDADGATNGQLLNMFITAATGNSSPNFGDSGGGEVDVAKA